MPERAAEPQLADDPTVRWEQVLVRLVDGLPYLVDPRQEVIILAGSPSHLLLPGLANVILAWVERKPYVLIAGRGRHQSVPLGEVDDTLAEILDALGLLIRRRDRSSSPDRQAVETEMIEMLRGTWWTPGVLQGDGAIPFGADDHPMVGTIQRTDRGGDESKATFTVNLQVPSLSYRQALEVLTGFRRAVPDGRPARPSLGQDYQEVDPVCWG